MTAAEESRGLRIIVATCIPITVVLLATSCFLYSAYAKARSVQDAAQKRYEELRLRIGARAEQHEQSLEEMVMHSNAVKGKLQSAMNEVDAAFTKSSAWGLQSPELERNKNQIQRVIAS